MLDLNERLAKIVAEYPRRSAVWAGDKRLTYAELAAAVQQVAAALTRHGIGPGTRVAVALEPGPELIVTLLATLHAGAAYVPLDPSWPARRTKLILDDARPMALVDSGEGGIRLSGGTRLRTLDATARIAVPADPVDRTAYIIYTSGTTGVPKGVPVSHRNVGALFDATEDLFDFRAEDRWLLFHAVTFDFSVWEIWGALLHGAALCVPQRWSVVEPRSAARLIARERITVLNQTPTAFSAVSAELLKLTEPTSLRYVVFGGERLLPASLRPWTDQVGLDRVALVNMYGITEITVHATFHRLTEQDLDNAESVIGTPLPGFAVAVLDGQDRPARRGELLLSGPQVVGGYLNRPELTEQKFVRLEGRGYYRSGDVVAVGADGVLRHLGRNDDQVKVRGFRIELGEVEQALSAVPGILAGCVLTLPDGRGGLELAGAYTAADAETGPTSRQVRAALRDALPLHMVPSRLKQVAALPRTGNGKVDRAALRDTWDALPRTAPATRTRLEGPMTTPEALRAAYAGDGWFPSPTRLDPETVAKLCARVEAISRQDRPEVVYEKEGNVVRAIHGCHEFDEVCRRLVRHPALLGLAEDLLGEPVYVYQFKVNMKQPREGAAWPWHQDYAFWSAEDGMPEDRAVNIAVFLDDTHHGNGPLKVVPGSHRGGLLGGDGQKRGRDWHDHVSADLAYTVPDRIAEELVAQAGIESAVGPAGTIYAFHPTIVHCSSNNLSDDRRALLLVTYNAVSNAPLHPTRPEFLVSRRAEALTPLADAVL